MRTLLLCLFIFLVANWAEATDLRQTYVGRSGCAPEFKSFINRNGIRLDKNTGAFLQAYEFRTGTILVIVRHRSDMDACGTIRDVIESQPADSSFVWECLDKRNPSAVVIGTWPSEHPSVSGPAIEAWRIDLKKLRFYRLKVPVVCDAGNYAGRDNGDDLADLARRRAAQQKTKGSPNQ